MIPALYLRKTFVLVDSASAIIFYNEVPFTLENCYTFR